MSALNKSYAALEHLKTNKLTILSKGSALNNDTVALEAEHKRGSIKKRHHVVLVEAIELIAQEVEKIFFRLHSRLKKLKIRPRQ